MFNVEKKHFILFSKGIRELLRSNTNKLNLNEPLYVDQRTYSTASLHFAQ